MILDILHFIFSSFWTWAGTLLIVSQLALFRINVNHERPKRKRARKEPQQ